jgi:hypothetical protein
MLTKIEGFVSVGIRILGEVKGAGMKYDKGYK